IMHWQVNGASRRELLAIDISAEFARLLAVLPTKTLRRGHRELPEERTPWDCQGPWQNRPISVAGKLEMGGGVGLEIRRQRSAIGAKEIVTPILAQLDVADTNLQNIADFRAAHENRAGEDVISGTAFDLLMDIAKLGQYVEARRTWGHPLRISRHAFDDDAVAGIDGQSRIKRAIEITPMDSIRTRSQQMRLAGPSISDARNVHRGLLM